MSYQFEGQSFSTLAALVREYPIYKSHTALIKDGITSVSELEKAIHVKREEGRARSLAQARKNNGYTFSRKAPGRAA